MAGAAAMMPPTSHCQRCRNSTTDFQFTAKIVAEKAEAYKAGPEFGRLRTETGGKLEARAGFEPANDGFAFCRPASRDATLKILAGVAKLADAPDSKSGGHKAYSIHASTRTATLRRRFAGLTNVRRRTCGHWSRMVLDV